MTKIAILIVEDERIIAKGIEKQLSAMGYRVAGSAKNGEDAVRKAIELVPDLILMDISLGAGIDGVEAASQIRAVVDIPIVYVTANSNDAILDRVKATDPFGYLLKPYDDRDLQTAIEIGLYRHRVERRLRDNEQWLAATLGSIGEGVIAADEWGQVRLMNGSAERLTGWSSAEARGRALADVHPLLHAISREPVNLAKVTCDIPATVPIPANSVLISRAGAEVAVDGCLAPIHGPNGRVTGLVMVFRDVGTSRSAALELTHSAQHDFLTKLPNRLLLDDRLTQAIGMARRHGQKVAVLFLDLDGFKQVNDSFGHATGDRLLQSVAARLVTSVRDSDTVCRLGGDEFIVLLTETRVDCADGVAGVVERLMQAVAVVHPVDGRDLQVAISVGVSIYPEDGLDAETLIAHADVAMYQAKEAGPHRYQFFRPDMIGRARALHPPTR